MVKRNTRERQTRCERCILMRKSCDGISPICTNCRAHKKGPLPCVYPEGQPSRSELEQRKMDEANTDKTKLEEQAANRKAAGITHGFGTGQYGTVPDSWPEKYGGKGGYQNMVDAAEEKKNKNNKRGRETEEGEGEDETAGADEEAEKKRLRKRRKWTMKPATTTAAAPVAVDAEEEEQEIDIAQGFPSLGGGAPTAGPMEVLAPRAPSLGTPFDPYTNPAWFNSQPMSEEEKEYEAMADRLWDEVLAEEATKPVYASGDLKGLVVVEDVEGAMRDLRADEPNNPALWVSFRACIEAPTVSREEYARLEAEEAKERGEEEEESAGK